MSEKATKLTFPNLNECSTPRCPKCGVVLIGIGYKCGSGYNITRSRFHQSDQCKLNVSEQKRAKLREAAAPFAAYAEGIMSVFEQMPDDHQACKIYSEKPASITIGDCKALVAARAADQEAL